MEDNDNLFSDIEEKYELVDYNPETKLYRIKAKRNFSNVKEGDIGGYVSGPDNLDHDGNCWIYDEAKALDRSWVTENSKLKNSAIIIDSAMLCNEAIVGGKILLTGETVIKDYAEVYGRGIINECQLQDNCYVNGDNIILSNCRVGNKAEILQNACLLWSEVFYGIVDKKIKTNSTESIYHAFGIYPSRGKFIFYKKAYSTSDSEVFVDYKYNPKYHYSIGKFTIKNDDDYFSFFPTILSASIWGAGDFILEAEIDPEDIIFISYDTLSMRKVKICGSINEAKWAAKLAENYKEEVKTTLEDSNDISIFEDDFLDEENDL